MNISDEIEKLIKIEENETTRFLSDPKQKAEDDEIIFGKLSKREIAIFSALKKAEADLWKLKIKLMHPETPLNHEKISLHEEIISRLKKILFANLSCRLKIKDANNCFKLRNGWLLVTDAL